MKNRGTALICLLLCFAILCSGCSTPIVRNSGLVSRYYDSPFQEKTTRPTPLPVALRVLSVTSEEPSVSPPENALTKAGLIVLGLLPVTSFFLPAAVEKNLVTTPAREVQADAQEHSIVQYQFSSTELQTILMEELKKNNLFDQVSLNKTPGDYYLQSEIDFTRSIELRMYGIGVFAGVAWAFGAPITIEHAEATAHFVMRSSKNDSVVFDKSYYADRLWKNNIHATLKGIYPEVYGAELFPEIIRSFTHDLLAVPEAAWLEKGR